MARFTNAVLVAILQKASRRVNRRLHLTGTTNQTTVNASGVMSPDNDDLEDIVLLQAECMIASREFQQELTDGTAGLLAVDGEQKLDTRGQSVARGSFFDSMNSPCAELKEAINLYNMSGTIGRLIY